MLVLEIEEPSDEGRSIVDSCLVKDGGQMKLDSALPNAKRLADFGIR
jgi:hypothetical protein